eukprot:gene1165-1475_t
MNRLLSRRLVGILPYQMTRVGAYYPPSRMAQRDFKSTFEIESKLREREKALEDEYVRRVEMDVMRNAITKKRGSTPVETQVSGPKPQKRVDENKVVEGGVGKLSNSALQMSRDNRINSTSNAADNNNNVNPHLIEFLNKQIQMIKSNPNADIKKTHIYKKAIQSLLLYPVPIFSGKECEILSGIGPSISKMIENYLSKNPQHPLFPLGPPTPLKPIYQKQLSSTQPTTTTTTTTATKQKQTRSKKSSTTTSPTKKNKKSTTSKKTTNEPTTTTKTKTTTTDSIPTLNTHHDDEDDVNGDNNLDFSFNFDDEDIILQHKNKRLKTIHEDEDSCNDNNNSIILTPIKKTVSPPSFEVSSPKITNHTTKLANPKLNLELSPFPFSPLSTPQINDHIQSTMHYSPFNSPTKRTPVNDFLIRRHQNLSSPTSIGIPKSPIKFNIHSSPANDKKIHSRSPLRPISWNELANRSPKKQNLKLNSLLKSPLKKISISQPTQLSKNPTCNNETTTISTSTTTTTTTTIQLPKFKDILCIIDNREVKSLTERDYIVTKLKEFKINSEVRKLEVGDFLWIGLTEDDQEWVLNYIVERKRVDDLSSSIMDGRYKEQKFRLLKCGCENIIYLVEGGVKHSQNKSWGSVNFGLPPDTLLSAMVSTQVNNGIVVHETQSLDSTIEYIQSITEYLKLKLVKSNPLSILFKGKPNQFSLDTFNFNNVKSKGMVLREFFALQLIQISGVSPEKAHGIISKYATPLSLWKVYNQQPDEKSAINLLKDLTYGSKSPKKKIGIALSEKIYNFFKDSKY